MDILEFQGQTRVLGAPAGWDQSAVECIGLPIMDHELSGVPCMSSFWRPTAEELAQLADGGHIKLTVIGRAHPAVCVEVGRCKVLVDRKST